MFHWGSSGRWYRGVFHWGYLYVSSAAGSENLIGLTYLIIQVCPHLPLVNSQGLIPSIFLTESMLMGQEISGNSIIKLPKSVYPVQCFWISIALGLKAEIGNFCFLRVYKLCYI